jgi:hypothetical protein
MAERFENVPDTLFHPTQRFRHQKDRWTRTNLQIFQGYRLKFSLLTRYSGLVPQFPGVHLEEIWDVSSM